MKRIIAKSNLRRHYKTYPDAEAALESWLMFVKHAHWQSPSDVIQDFPYADSIKNSRIVFNIKGNKYRLVVAINYQLSIVYIRWFGTHKEYDRIDVETI